MLKAKSCNSLILKLTPLEQQQWLPFVQYLLRLVARLAFSHTSSALGRHLLATERGDITAAANSLTLATFKAETRSETFYDESLASNLYILEPHVNDSFTPDLADPLSTSENAAVKNNWSSKLNSSIVGSCTNGSNKQLKKVQHLV